jgi:Spy/CpxP family protein refolding chaperone
MNKTIVYVVALVAVSLIAGALLGVVLSHRQGPPEYGQIPGRFMQGQTLRHDEGPLEKLSQILNLSADQKVKLDKILKESRQEVMQIQHRTEETFMEIKKKTDAKIREILTLQQQVKFDSLESDLQQRISEERAHPRFLNRFPDGNGPMPGGAPDEEVPQPEPAK